MLTTEVSDDVQASATDTEQQSTNQLAKPSTATKLRPPAPKLQVRLPPTDSVTTSTADVDTPRTRKRKMQFVEEEMSFQPGVATVPTRSARPSGLQRAVAVSAAPAKAPIVKSTRTVTQRAAVTKNVTGRSTTVKAPIETASAEANQPARKKRAAWDTKGRLEDMENVATHLQSQLSNSSNAMNSLQLALVGSEQRVQELERFRITLETQVKSSQHDNSHLNQSLSELRQQLKEAERDYEHQLSQMKAEHARTKDEAESVRKRLERDSQELENKLKIKETEAVQLQASLSAQSASMVALESQQRALKISVESLEGEKSQLLTKVAQLEKDLMLARQQISEMEQKSHADELERRRLHNQVQELKGNIRVFCRVRPLLANELETSSSDQVQLEFPIHAAFDPKEIHLIQTSLGSVSDASKSVTKSFPFSFDRVFAPSSTQAEVFNEIAQLVQSALDGYRVCIFAYGVTCSGKTFTMEGGAAPEQRGMIPRSVQHVFKVANEMKERGWQYTMQAQYLEIYNETLRDLLSLDDGSKKLEIKHIQGSTIVTDLTVVSVTDAEQVMQLLAQAQQQRAVGETQCNERSSRSHSVFTLKLQGFNEATQETTEGLLHLIDLAGSERLSSSGSTGDRLKETQAINKSLSALGDVISALASQSSHIPYRNSKLTYLLQHSLGGQCKTLMFVNISPAAAHVSETLCSLRFATKVNACQIGTAKRMVSVDSKK